MPSKSDKIYLNDPFLKRSAKLLPCQKEMILWWRERGSSTRDLAKRFKVSRRLIQFTLDPDKLNENKKRRAERGGFKVYYDKDQNTIAQRDYRHYKAKVFYKL